MKKFSIQSYRSPLDTIRTRLSGCLKGTSLLLFLLVFLFAFRYVVFAQIDNPIRGALRANVSASVGEFYLNLSGYISPFASIVLSSDGIFIRATVADQYGNFSISQVLIRRGFSHFCLDAVDFRRIGESLTCFNIPPAQDSVTMKDLFLPPTLGLSRTQIAAGGEAIAFGYTMPGAIVTLDINGKKLVTTADSSGYYEFRLKNLKAGTYILFASANYKSKDSLQPSKKLQLKALNWWEQFLAFLKELWHKFLVFLTSLALGPLWLVIPIIILIIILLLKIWPEKFTFIYRNRLTEFFFDFFGKGRKLHHAWWMGY